MADSDDRNHHGQPNPDMHEPGGMQLGTKDPTDAFEQGRNQTGVNVAEPLEEQPIALVPDTQRGRLKWTNDMNEYLLRSFLRITNNEQRGIKYSTELHRRMIEKYPILRTKTVQNILDQRRAIMQNNRIDANTINRIRREVCVELGILTETNAQNNINDEHQRETGSQEEENTNTEQESIRQKLRIICEMYEGIPPNLKPKLPKLVRPQRKIWNIIEETNSALDELMTENDDIRTIHNLIYAGALFVIEQNGQDIKKKSKKPPRKDERLPWQRRMDRKISDLRAKIGILTQAKHTNASNRTKKRAAEIQKNYPEHELPATLETLKQTLKATAAKLARHTKSYKRKQDNTSFNTSERQFYRRNLEQQKDRQKQNQDRFPEPKATEEFWKGIWEDEKKHKAAQWIRRAKNEMRGINTMTDWEINENEVKQTVKNTSNWKTPGPDSIHNFWLKRLSACHKHLARLYTTGLNNPQTFPEFLSEGVTYLLPKGKPTSENPAKYRPITCLCTTYKLLTSIIANKIYKHMENNNLLDEEQKGCRKNSKGCKEQLIIDSIITGHAKRKKKSLYCAYIDYQKAFDSVPHSWLIEVLTMFGINNTIVNFLGSTMAHWKTKLVMPGLSECELPIAIKRGIFQGDALSALWFTIALKPLTMTLNALRKGYPIDNETQISHILYMDDLKLYTDSREKLRALLTSTEKFSKDIGMSFGIEKCRTSAMEKGEWVSHEGYETVEKIEGMEKEEAYKYLGYLQARGIEIKIAKQQIKQDIGKRTSLIMKTELNAANKIKAINTFAISVLQYSFGVIPWTHTEIEELEREIRVKATKYRMHHPRSSKIRFHLPRKDGGRGIADLQQRIKTEENKLRKYFSDKASTSSLHRSIIAIDHRITPLNLQNREEIHHITNQQEKIRTWKSMPLHGRYPNNIDNPHIDKQASLSWTKKGNLYPETEGTMFAIQDQVILTKYYKKHIMKTTNDDICRICKDKQETIDHILSSCSILAPKQYTERHNNVAKIIYQELGKLHELLEEHKPYYTYIPEKVVENEKYKLLWNWPIRTDKTITHNTPDIVLIKKETKETIIIDIAIPNAANLQKKYEEKISKYLPLAEELQRIWKMNICRVVPIVIGATGEIPKTLKTSLEKLDLKPSLYLPAQKAVILSTCRIVREVLQNDTLPRN